MRKYLSCVIVGALTMLVSAPVHADGGVSPLSGRPGGEGKPVVMVKLDNTALARPHTGLREADLVYVEEVE